MKLVPNNWLYNAGLVGLLRILEEKGVNIDARLSTYGFELQEEDLEGFSNAYFKHVLLASLPRFIPSLDQKERELLGSFDVKYAETRNDCLRQLRQDLQASITIEQAEQMVKVAINAFANNVKIYIEKGFGVQQAQLSQITPKDKTEQKEAQKKEKELLRNRERAEKVTDDKIPAAIGTFEKQKYVVDALKRFYFNKDVVANYSLAKGQTRAHQFEQKYVGPLLRLLEKPREESDQNNRICCKFCGHPFVDLSEERLQDAVYNEGMFSVSGLPLVFENFFYNLIPDLFICNICELILLCAWAGFNQVPFRLRSGGEDSEYIFVNLPSLSELWNENESVRKRYEIAQASFRDTIYEEIISELFSRERKERSKWVLQNVLFVEIRTVPSKQRDKPTFKYFHVGKDVADLFISPSVNRSLSHITGRLAAPGDKKGTYSLQLKREVTKRLLSGDQLYDITYQVCRQSLDTARVHPKSVVEIVLLHSLRRQIWRKYAAKYNDRKAEAYGGRIMEPKQVYGILRGLYNVGASLGQSMELEKRQRLAYRLMSVVRSGKSAEFYDMLMKLCIDSKRPVPTELLGLLDPIDDIEFEAKAYAVLSGFLGENRPATTVETAIAESQEVIP
jgi:CRISPR-associated protein Cst1